MRKCQSKKKKERRKEDRKVENQIERDDVCVSVKKNRGREILYTVKEWEACIVNI